MKKRIVALLLAMMMIGSSVGYASGEDESAEQLPGECAEQLPADAPEPVSAEIAEPAAADAEIKEDVPSVALIISHEELPENETEEPVVSEATESEDAVLPDEGLPENETEEPVVSEATESEDAVLPDESEPDSDSQEDDEPAIVPESEETIPDNSESIKQGIEGASDAGDNENAETAATNEEVSPATQRQITISNLSWDQTKKYLLFQFSSSDDDTEYEAHLLGCNFELKQKGDGVYSGTETECYTKLATAIADAFYNKTSFDINDTVGFCNEYGLIPHPIDAEKVSLAADSKDSYLCWAASASNMLKFSGWELVNKETGATLTVDEMYDLFRTNFTNNGSNQEVGIKWYNNGVNTRQAINSAGDIVYPGDSKVSSSAQQKYKDNPAWTGYYPDYAVESYTERHGLIGIDSFLEAAETLDQGNAVGIAIESVNSKGVPAPGGHAITLFGYIKTFVQQGIEELKAIFFTDSDNNVVDDAPRSSIIDSVTMYTLSPATYVSNTDHNTYSTYSLDGYYCDSEYKYVITDYTTLKNRAAVEKSEYPDSGTKSSQTCMDLHGKQVYTTDLSDTELSEVYVGEQVKIQSVVENISYCKLTKDEYAKSPHLYGKVSIYKEDSKDVYATEYIDVLLEDYDGAQTPDLLPNQSLILSNKHVFSEPGTYYYVIEIYGIKNQDGTKVKEAYLGNNTTISPYKIVVKEKPVPGTDESRDSGMEKITTFTTSYDRASNLPLTVTVRIGDFKGVNIDFGVKSAVLKNRKNTEYGKNFPSFVQENEQFLSRNTLDNPVNSDSVTLLFAGRILDETVYTITKNADGTVSLTFNSEFLKTLDKGQNQIVVQAPGGDTLFIIYIDVV